MTKIITSGKRKSAVARAVLEEGTGNVFINGRDYKTLEMFDRLKIAEPIRITEQVLGKLNFDVRINSRGGGKKGQIEVARLSLARGILKFTKSKELEKKFSDYDWSLLVADVRRKETYKPGDSKARSRRQKSYR